MAHTDWTRMVRMTGILIDTRLGVSRVHPELKVHPRLVDFRRTDPRNGRATLAITCVWRIPIQAAMGV